MPRSRKSRNRQDNRTGGGERGTQPSGDSSGAADTPQHNAPSPDQDSSAGQTGQSRSSRRLQRQNLKQRFMKLREDAQLQGLIPTEPAEAVKDERSPAQPRLVQRAIREGWAVPDEIKPELVQELVAVVMDESEEASDKTKVAAFRALLTADQAQHERNNPQKTAKGGQVNVSVQTNIAAVDVLRAALSKDGHISSTESTPPPSITGSTSNS